MNKIISVAVALAALLSAHTTSASEPSEGEKVKQLILARDAEFWNDYNTCDTSHYDRFFTRDLEFYHDRGGVTLGIDAMIETIKKNLCGGSKPHLRRDPVPDTARLFLLNDGSGIYGAILSGEHIFSVIEPNQPPRPESRARYVHLWLKRDGEFKMARIVSYDHASIESAPTAAIVSLSPRQLDRFAGKFTASKSGEITAAREDDHLALDVGGRHMAIYPINETTFILKDRDVSFEFRLSPQGTPTKVIVREHGSIVEEAIASGTQ